MSLCPIISQGKDLHNCDESNCQGWVEGKEVSDGSRWGRKMSPGYCAVIFPNGREMQP